MKGWGRPGWRRWETRRKGKKILGIMEITYRDIKENEEIHLLIEKGNQVMRALGYTEHSKKHAARVAETAGRILKELGYGKKAIELSKIAGYMHDIGNSINRHDHAHSGAALAYQILKGMKMPLEDILVIVTAIGHHDESTGTAVDVVSRGSDPGGQDRCPPEPGAESQHREF